MCVDKVYYESWIDGAQIKCIEIKYTLLLECIFCFRTGNYVHVSLRNKGMCKLLKAALAFLGKILDSFWFLGATFR